MKVVAGEVAFVTGAGSGIGLGIARALARAGAHVVAGDIRADAVEAAAAEIGRIGPRAGGVVVDVSDQASVDAAASEIEEKFGPVTILVNNAGVAMHGVPVEDIPLADWDWVIGVNVYGVIHGIRTFVPRLRRAGRPGHIVNTASIGGFQVNPGWHTGAYSMTKYAVVALSEALRNELAATPVGVSVLAPASVDTGIHLSGRARPDRLGGPCERPETTFMGDLNKDGMDPDAVGERVVRAIRDDEFFVFTHEAPREWIEARHRRIVEAFDRVKRPSKSEEDAA